MHSTCWPRQPPWLLQSVAAKVAESPGRRPRPTTPVDLPTVIFVLASLLLEGRHVLSRACPHACTASKLAGINQPRVILKSRLKTCALLRFL